MACSGIFRNAAYLNKLSEYFSRLLPKNYSSSKSETPENASSKIRKRRRSKTLEQPTIQYGNSLDKNQLLPDTIWSSLSFVIPPQEFRPPLPKRANAKKGFVADILPESSNDAVLLAEDIASAVREEVVAKVEPPVKTPKVVQVKVNGQTAVPTKVSFAVEDSDAIKNLFPLILSDKNIIADSGNGIITYALETGQNKEFPSVTQVLRDTMSEESSIVLAMWRKRKIAEVGEEGLKTYMRDVKNNGKDLHLSIETHLRGVPYNSVHVDPRIAGHWLSLRSVFSSLSEVRALESYVIHPQLKYKGYVDCVAHYKDTLAVIDWKTSHRTKASLDATYDDPVQVAAYVGALNADPKYPFTVDRAVLVVAYPTGLPADVHILDRGQCEKYWDAWLQRLTAFREKNK